MGNEEERQWRKKKSTCWEDAHSKEYKMTRIELGINIRGNLSGFRRYTKGEKLRNDNWNGLEGLTHKTIANIHTKP